MDDIQILMHIWLSKEEALIYSFLIKKWYQSITDISREVWLYRHTIYKIIPNLIDYWLVSQMIKWKRKLFLAESPDNLNNLYERNSFKFKTLLNRFQDIYKSKDESPTSVKVIEWENFSKFVFEDIWNTLEKKGEYYRYSSKKKFDKKDNIPIYKILRDKKEIQRYIITSENLNQDKPKRLDHEVAIIPEKFDLFTDNISKVIYKNKVGIIDYNNEISFIFENQKLADFEKKLFKLLFKYLKK